MRRTARALAILVIAGAAALWFATEPDTLPASAIEGMEGDPGRGELVFAAAGCASCHAAEDAEGEASPLLAGGQRFPSEFGTFVAPNISPDPDHGIGAWTDIQIVNAVMRGVRPDGSHNYPAFPYTAYNKAEVRDIVDLVAHLRSLPPSAEPSRPHEVGFPFNIRRAVGGWKFLFLSNEWVVDGGLTPEQERGRYLAEALGHCGECHTPRNALGALNRSAWYSGAPNPAGRGRIPNITPAELDWSAFDIGEYLTTGFTPEFDTAGGHMALVVQNISKLPESDRAAIAAYLKAVPPVASN